MSTPPNPPHVDERALTLDSISVTVIPPVPDDPDEITTKEERWLKHAKAHVEITGLAQNIQMRRIFCGGIFLLGVLWLVGMFVLLMFQGLSWHGFKLTENVILAAIGAMTVHIIGLLYVVV